MEVDASRPLEEVVRGALRGVLEALAARGVVE